uniref:EamA domain-containing protein n=1 Tax=Brassica campestris TaxID=3711 RepID=M4ELF2_BRACM
MIVMRWYEELKKMVKSFVSLGDSESNSTATDKNPPLGDVLSLISAVFYAVYITLIRKKLPDDDDEKSGWFSMAQLLGFLGLLDNVLSDYLCAKAVLLTTTTVASAGLTIQVPLAAIVDSLSGNKPSFTDFIGAAAVMVGFAGINIPAEIFHRSKET